MVTSNSYSRTLALLAAGAFVFTATSTIHAQQHSMQSMSQAAPEAMIDGAQHPELILNATAYRLVFVVLGLPLDATTDQKQLQTLRLQNAGLTGADISAAALALNSFRIQYEDRIKAFNDSAHNIISGGGTPDIHGFDVSRDALVQAARNQLKQALSASGMAAIDSFVQGEKSRMHVPVGAQ